MPSVVIIENQTSYKLQDIGCNFGGGGGGGGGGWNVRQH